MPGLTGEHLSREKPSLPDASASCLVLVSIGIIISIVFFYLHWCEERARVEREALVTECKRLRSISIGLVCALVFVLVLLLVCVLVLVLVSVFFGMVLVFGIWYWYWYFYRYKNNRRIARDLHADQRAVVRE